MPSNWETLDNNFPTFRDGESADRKIDELLNYLYVMKEQLQYSLRNLSAENWNDVALQEITDSTRADLVEQLQKVGNQLSQLSGKVDSLNGRVSGLEGLNTRVGDVEEKVENVEVQLENIALELSEIRTMIAEIETRVNELGNEIGTVKDEIDKNKTSIAELMQKLTDAEAEIQEISGIVKVTDDGAAVGNEGKALHLIGNVYINGVLITPSEGGGI